MGEIDRELFSLHSLENVLSKRKFNPEKFEEFKKQQIKEGEEAKNG